MTVPSLRTARRTDIEPLLLLWQEAAENATRSPGTPAAVGALLDHDPDALLLAECDGELVGSIIAGWDGWRAHVYRLAVQPGHRRQGIGTALVMAAERRLRELGATRVDAMVLDANHDGQQVWEAQGYHRNNGWSRWIKTVTP